MYNRLGTIPACDRRTDRYLTIVRAMHTRRALKISMSLNKIYYCNDMLLCTSTSYLKIDFLIILTNASRYLHIYNDCLYVMFEHMSVVDFCHAVLCGVCPFVCHICVFCRNE